MVHATNSWSNNFTSCPHAGLQWPRAKALSSKTRAGEGEEASQELRPRLCQPQGLSSRTLKSNRAEQPSKTEYVVALILPAWQQIQRSELVVFYSVPLVLMSVCCSLFLKGAWASGWLSVLFQCSMFVPFWCSRAGRTKQKPHQQLCNTIVQ